ncbi:MAG: prepilin-type N-terminal cleavage/methylation domain-containing protein, partial [Aestuariivirgaceae bacterium]|nr:prepilin-type N-terminal cleavage/methylation domain-containing protein [Aestuariivirgaceae bacterium]
MSGTALSRNEGFTLLEVLLSLAIGTIVMGVVLGSVRLGTHFWKQGETSAIRREMVDRAAAVLSADLRHMREGPFAGDAERIEFVMTGRPRMSSGPIAQVRYEVRAGEQTFVVLRRERAWRSRGPGAWSEPIELLILASRPHWLFMDEQGAWAAQPAAPPRAIALSWKQDGGDVSIQARLAPLDRPQ